MRSVPGSKTEKELNYRVFPFDPRTIDAVILTHAHIDHSGLLPKLVKAGSDGPIFATPGTIDLCSVMLPDSAHIQESEVEHLNRRNQRRGRLTVAPIYTAEDAAVAVTLLRAVELETWQTAAEGIRFRFWNAGHLLGSASVEMEIAGSPTVRMLFSGDIGPSHKLLQFDRRQPAGTMSFARAPMATRTASKPRTRLAARRCGGGRGGNPSDGALLVPSFAVERGKSCSPIWCI